MNFSAHFVRFNLYLFCLSGLAMLWLSIMGIKEMRAAELAIWVCYGIACLILAGIILHNDEEAEKKERIKLAKEVAKEALKMYEIGKMQEEKATATTKRITGGEA